MKSRALPAIVFALMAAAAAAPVHAQATQEMQFPGHDGSLSPPSTLRMTVTPQGPAVPPPPPVRDSPESVRQYTQCRDDADREATSAAKMREAVGRCLDELNQRRAQGQ
ncbi:hypothetical protein [Bordetella bronchialis]|uniref:Uncharacterized protein n=1 Tax=Bordetella bronchialis TaxID=463025 RepID=A0A193FSQ6_9BORD|nr:hypothetical protein [Bordetella bronchialis]ANN65752.1 hypothetical protein BAU06_05095 [Bordetella bronchialis]ANN70782.1 hypothetical protein BAU08_05065 [Bordetella bronchialis]